MIKNKVYFIDEDHSYYYNGEKYKSNSSVIKSLEPDPFNSDLTSKICAIKELDIVLYNDIKKNAGGYIPEKIVKMYEGTLHSHEKGLYEETALSFVKKWNDKSQLGTDFHLKMENLDKENGKCLNKYNKKVYDLIPNEIPEGVDNIAYSENMYDIPDGYFPEFLVFDHDLGIAGQIDKLFVETTNGVRYVDIDDWKSDEKIDVKPTFFKKGKGYDRMKFPFDHLYTTKYYIYTLKTSLYAYMLERAGFTIRDIRFTHVMINPDTLEILKETDYNVDFKRQEFEYYFTNL